MLKIHYLSKKKNISFLVKYDAALLRNVDIAEAILDCSPVLTEREEMVCILPTQMMLEDAYSLAEKQCLLPLIKKFSKELFLSC